MDSLLEEPCDASVLLDDDESLLDDDGGGAPLPAPGPGANDDDVSLPGALLPESPEVDAPTDVGLSPVGEADPLEVVAVLGAPPDVADATEFVRSSAARTDAGDNGAGRELVTESETDRMLCKPSKSATSVARPQPPTSNQLRRTIPAWLPSSTDDDKVTLNHA